MLKYYLLYERCGTLNNLHKKLRIEKWVTLLFCWQDLLIISLRAVSV